ncbi:MAG: sugar transferase [Novosphingobium sp.]
MSLDLDCIAAEPESVDFHYRDLGDGPYPRARRRLATVAFKAPVPAIGAWEAGLIRAFDVVSASLLLVAMLPFLVLLAIALQIDSPGRLFFVQMRVGAKGVMFPCLKFRTMVANADEVLARQLEQCQASREEWANDFKLRNDPRVTRLGRIVRRLSLDELPQLLNIICGHMSVVGPRPIVRAEIERYGRFFASYCSVKPGLTGLWQVSGRNDVTYHERVMLDVQYVENKSFLADIAIVMRTIPAVAMAKGSY